MIRTFAVAPLAMLIAVQPAMAQTACITRSEVQAASRFLLPTLVKALATKCRTTLPETAYILTQGTALADRFAPLADDGKLLTSIMGKMDEKMAAAMDIETAKPFFGAMIAQSVTSDIKPETCPTIDNALRLLDPLPAENLVAMVELIAVEMDGDRARKAAKGGKPAKQGLCPVTLATP